VLANIDKADFELWSLAVSALNGCGMCIDAYEKVLRQTGITAEQIQSAFASLRSSRPSLTHSSERVATLSSAP
jgi:AhpD family alkylhydroperoxidase